MQNQRNLIWAAVLTGLLLLAWDAGTRWFYPQAGRTKPAVTAPAAEPSAKATPTREGGVERDFAMLHRELVEALARATAGKGDPPRRKHPGKRK